MQQCDYAMTTYATDGVVHREQPTFENTQAVLATTGTRIFAYVLRQVYSLGFLEFPVGPWCYGQQVKIMSNNMIDTEFAGQHGTVLWPDEGILNDWLLLNRQDDWKIPPHRLYALNPANAVAVFWNNGRLRFHRADVEHNAYDLQLVVSPLGDVIDNATCLHSDANCMEEDFISFSEESIRTCGCWEGRRQRFVQLSKHAHVREVMKSFTKRKKRFKKRCFNRFLQYEEQTFLSSRDVSFQWWQFRKLFG